MNKIAILGGAALVLAVPHASAMAQDSKKVAEPTQEQMEHGFQTFQLLASAMQSKNVPDDVKSVLMPCMYANPIGKISEALDKVIADNPGKIDRSKPDVLLGVIAHICGYEPKEAAGAPATGNAPPSGAAKGR